jgi:hypothetical protein
MTTTAASTPPKLETPCKTRNRRRVRLAAPYQHIIPGISETDLEWGYVHTNQLNEGERLSRAEPEDWNLALKEQLTARVEQNTPDKPQRILSQRVHLPVDSTAISGAKSKYASPMVQGQSSPTSISPATRAAKSAS